MPQATYADLMVEGTPYIELRIDLKEPADLFDLVRAFSAVGNQFDEYLKREHRDLEGSTRLFVKQIRAGSIIVELIPMIVTLVQAMDTGLIVDGFVNRFRALLSPYLAGNRVQDLSRNDIRDVLSAVKLIANDPDGRAAISSLEYHKTKTTERVSVHWDTSGAKKAAETLERQQVEISLPAYEVFENVLMVFWQSNLKDPLPGKRTGEMATIEAVSPKPLAIVYETDLARERIKHETEQGDRNLYKLGFYVDCYVERFQGRAVSYRITNVRSIIPLPDDD